MSESAVAKLALDTRAHGPYVCENCDEENEDAILMTSGAIVCPKCKTQLAGFQMVSDIIVSAAPIKQGKGRKSKRWAIHWQSPDTSQEGTTVYDNMQEALEAACSWIKDQADMELDGLRNTKKDVEAGSEHVSWSEEDDEHVELLEGVLKDIEANKLAEAVENWLEYQGDTDPQDRIEIGPSGDVTDSASDFRRSVDLEAA